MFSSNSAEAIAEELGQRLKQARLNADLTQAELADQAGLTVKLIQGAEKGKAQLLSVVAILQALELTGQLKHFIPEQPLSPVQLSKLKGKQRQRASGSKKINKPEDLQW